LNRTSPRFWLEVLLFEPLECSIHSFIHSFIHQWLYSPLLGSGLFFSPVIFFTQTVGLLGRAISPSQGRYLHTGQQKHRINAHTDIHALSGIRAHDSSVRAGEDSSCFRRRGHRGRLSGPYNSFIVWTYNENIIIYSMRPILQDVYYM
jgi:hypothetical protein